MDQLKISSFIAGTIVGAFSLAFIVLLIQNDKLETSLAEMEASQITLESAAQCKDGGQYPYAGNTDQSIIIFICDTPHTGAPTQ